jgi:hypothetical protein
VQSTPWHYVAMIPEEEGRYGEKASLESIGSKGGFHEADASRDMICTLLAAGLLRPAKCARV